MSLNRTPTLLAAWILVLAGVVPALAAHPIGVADMQPFAPADMSTYGGGYRANQGFFFSYDHLLWWPGKPDPALLGDATTRTVVLWAQDPDADDDGEIDPGFAVEKVIEFSTHDTGELNTEQVSGQRYEFGFVEEHHGWLCSILNVNEQTQRMYASDVHVVFDDAPFGAPPQFHLQGYIDDDLTLVDDLPVRFDELEARYTAKMWGAELSYLCRTHPFHGGGILEWFVGARYMEINDRLSVEAFEFLIDEDDPANGLGDSFWINDVENHIVGPQVGVRYFRKCSRWTWATEARFFSGFNSQDVKLRGGLGSNLDPANAGVLEIRNMPPTQFNHTRHFDEWSPAAELRVDLRYQLTRSISAGAGWTGIWIDGIARAPALIDYSLGQNSAMGITNLNHEDMFTHGFTIKIEFNR